MKPLLYGILLPAFFLCASCGSTREGLYFSDLKDSQTFAMTPVPESIIHNNDILSIIITDLNPEATALLNQSNTSGTDPQAGYLVNSDGFIQFPLLGNIKVAGLTKTQLKDFIIQSLKDKKLSKDPLVNIRIVNFQITILGDVGNPSVMNVPSEKISLLEAIAKAGDLDMQARRDNILLIREENDQKIIRHINLTTNEIFTSPYYYLKHNDIIYVEPNKTKLASAKRTPQWIGLVLSGVTFAIGMVTYFTK